MSLVISPDFQHILRVLNTNIDGRRKVMYAITAIPGVGRRFANVVCKKAAVDAHKRAGELTADEVEKLVAIIQNPKQFKIPTWFLNRQKDYKTGKYSQAFANTLHTTLRSDLERLKKIRAHRGLRHYWCIRVRGQHTKSTGRRGKTMAATAEGGSWGASSSGVTPHHTAASAAAFSASHPAPCTSRRSRPRRALLGLILNSMTMLDLALASRVLPFSVAVA